MQGQQLVEEYEQEPTSSTSLIDKQYSLIEYNISKLSVLTKASLVLVICRMLFVGIVFTFDEYFLTYAKGTQSPESWNSIIYFLASMIDSMALVNNIRVLQILAKERVKLEQVRTKLAEDSTVEPQTLVGSYRNYLSYFKLVQIYRMENRYHISYSQTVNFLQVFFTFYTFGQMAINNQVVHDSSALPVVSLWFFLVCVSFTTFEQDYRAMEGSTGPLEGKKVRQDSGVEEDEQYVIRVVKDRYFRKCRQPYLIVYVLTVILGIVTLIFYAENRLFYYLLVVSMLMMAAEFAYQLHSKDKLADLQLECNQTIYTPYAILKKLTVYGRLHLLLCSGVRIVMVLTVMAFFRLPAVPSYELLLIVSINIGFIVSQRWKFAAMSETKLYVLESHKNREEDAGIDCPICLMKCQANEKVIRLPCAATHIFHATCMKQWFRQSKQCPLCRYRLDMYDIS